MRDFPLFPEQASTFAGQIDGLYWLLVALSLIFGGVLPFIILYLMVRYHRSQKVNRSNQIHGSIPLELTWTVIPLVLVMAVFFWGAFLYVQMRTPPAQTLEIYVIGKQWMWHTQHPNGKRENNELHVPIGQPVKLIMTSQDVIHSFYVPAFRVKQDVLPGRYTTMWFEATKAGEYHLFCAEYCGTEHSRMGGRVVAMTLADYELWLTTPGEVILPDGSVGAGGGNTTAPAPVPAGGDPMALVGGQLFADLGCAGCHRSDGAGVGPSLENVFGTEQPLADGSVALADESFLAESILNPGAKIVAGYGPVMPAYEGQLSEDQVNQLIAYIKSLSSAGAAGGATDGGATAGPEATAAPGATAEATAEAATTATSAPAATATTAPTATSAATATAAATATSAPAATATSAPDGDNDADDQAFDAALAAQGEQLFVSLGCVGCHNPAGGGVGPSLVGIYNQPQPLVGGGSAVADEAYLIESILNAQAKVVDGYQPIMPAYQGQLSDEQVRQLVEYIKSQGE